MSELDPEGYPSEAALKTAEQWPYEQGFHELLAYVQALWIYPGFFRREGNTYKLSTGGWSGHEDLIRALQDNRRFWALCWVSSRRGGHYEFEVPAQPTVGQMPGEDSTASNPA